MEGLKEYIKLVSDSFDQKSRYINSFTNHAPTIGLWKELILKEFVRRHIPKRFSVSSGFIYRDRLNVSPQIDILIYDSLSYEILFEFSDVVIVRPESVFGTIEVKSRLDKTGLYKAIEDSIKIRKICKGKNICSKCELLFFGGLKKDTIKGHIRNYKGPIGNCLDSIHCLSNNKNYSLIWSGDTDGNSTIHHVQKHPYYQELMNIDGKKYDKAFYSFFFSLCFYLDTIQGYFDKRFEKNLYNADSSTYLKYLNDDVRVLKDDITILGKVLMTE